MATYAVKDNTLADGASLKYPNARKFARLSTGRIYTIYVRSDGAYNQVYVAYTDDDGVNWTEEAVTTTNVSKYQAGIAVDSNDKLHISYNTAETSGTVYYVGKAYGGNWSAPLSISTYRVDSCIVVNSSNHIWIFVYSSYHYEIRYHISTNGGTSFSASATAFSDAYQNHVSGGLAVAVDSNDDIHVTALLNVAGHCYHKYKMYDSSAATWGDIEIIMNYIYDGYSQTSIAVDSNNVPHVVMADRGQFPTKERIYYANRIGGAWNAAILISDASYAAPECSIAIDLSDYIHVAYHGYNAVTTTYFQIGYRKSTDAGTNFSAIAYLTTGNTHKRYPALLWSRWAVDGTMKINIPATGYFLLFVDDDDIKVEVSNDLTWDSAALTIQEFLDYGVGIDICNNADGGHIYSDSGLGTDIYKNADGVYLFSDSGLGTDLFKTIGAIMKYVDSGAGVDVYYKYLEKIFSDSGSGVDVFIKLGKIVYNDVGAGVESSLTTDKLIVILDSGLAIDTSLVNKVTTFAESCSGIDNFLLKGQMLFKDYAIGVDIWKVSYPYPTNLKRIIIFIRDKI